MIIKYPSNIDACLDELNQLIAPCVCCKKSDSKAHFIYLGLSDKAVEYMLALKKPSDLFYCLDCISSTYWVCTSSLAVHSANEPIDPEMTYKHHATICGHPDCQAKAIAAWNAVFKTLSIDSLKDLLKQF